MRRALIVLVLVLLSAGRAWFLNQSRERSVPEPSLAVVIRSDCTSPDSVDYWFPPRLLESWGPGFEDSARIYYGLFFRQMREPSLSCGKDSSDAYRFTSLTVNGVPLSVRSNALMQLY